MFNRVLIAGELCADPEQDFETQSCVGLLRASHHDQWSSEEREVTLPLRVLGEDRAKSAATWFRQGAKLLVRGHLRDQSEGGIELVVESWSFLSDRTESQCLFLEPQAA